MGKHKQKKDYIHIVKQVLANQLDVLSHDDAVHILKACGFVDITNERKKANEAAIKRGANHHQRTYVGKTCLARSERPEISMIISNDGIYDVVLKNFKELLEGIQSEDPDHFFERFAKKAEATPVDAKDFWQELANVGLKDQDDKGPVR